MVEDVITEIAERGYATIPDAISLQAAARARTALDDLLASTPRGRDDFEGRRTRRVYALFAKTRALDDLAIHPEVLAVLDRVLGHYQLSAPAGISIGPHEAAQPLHPDDAIYPLPRPHPEIVVNVMWPLQDFTEANGATRIIPGSHHWGDERPAPDAETVTIEMAPGTALLYSGSVWHGGGANHTDGDRLGVVLHYAASWLRPVENHVLAVPPEQARTLPVRLQELLGYNIHPPFIGYVDGRHPRTLLSERRDDRSSDGAPPIPATSWSADIG